MFNDIQFLTDIMHISPICLNHKQNASLQVVHTFIPHLETYRMQVLLRHQSPPGFHIYKSPKNRFPAKSNVFHCNSSHFVSSMHICDGDNDCPDKSDEEVCVGNKSQNTTSRNLINMTPTYVLLHFKTRNGCHVKYTSTTNSADSLSANDKQLRSDVWISAQQNISTSTKPQECFPCGSEFECFHMFEICSYRLNLTELLIPCSNGKHIEKCKKFTCNMMFRCPQFYCIPWEYVCNGRWDCPLGTEEAVSCKSKYFCRDMFKCKDTSLCIDVGTVCDGFKNCPFEDDEYLCELRYVQCPLTCQCLAQAIACTDTGTLLVFPDNAYPYIYAHIQNVVVLDQNMFRLFTAVMHIEVMNVEIANVCAIWSSKRIFGIVLNFNTIPVLPSLCFVNHTKLRNVRLDSNGLQFIKEKAFADLPELNILSLTNNSLYSFNHLVLDRVNQLLVLLLSENKFIAIDSTTFSPVLARTIQTSSFKICCFTPHEMKCASKSRKPWYVPCTRVLTPQPLQISFILTAHIILILNAASAIISICQTTKNKGFCMLVVSTNTIECIWSMFFFTIFVADTIFLGSYVLHEHTWRSSVMCLAATDIFLNFSFIDPCVIFLLSLTRFRLSANPLSSKFRDEQFSIKLVTKICFCCFLATTSLLSALKIQTHALPSKLCLPIEDPTHSIPQIYFLTWILGLYQIPAAIAVGLCHFLLVKTIQASKKVVGEGFTGKSTTTSLLVQLIAVTFSNSCSWFPSNVIFILFLHLHRYPPVVVPWILVTLVSVNCLVNPVVFISTSLRSIFRNAERQPVKEKDFSRNNQSRLH